MTLLLTAADLELAREMAYYSAAAYPTAPYADGAHLTLLGGVDAVWMVNGQFSALVITDHSIVLGGRTTLAVTGTRNLANFITDDKCVQTPIDYARKLKVQVGFNEGLEALWPRVETLLKRLNTAQFCLTGHSLGGAIVRMISAKMALNDYPRPDAIVTIGEPRSLNQYGADLMDDLGLYSRRWVNKLDIVPRLPLITLLPPRHLFWHCAHSIWMEPTGGLEVDRPWWKKIKSDLAGLRMEWALRNLSPLTGDHSSARYVAALASAVLV